MDRSAEWGNWRPAWWKQTARRRADRAFSSEVDTGSREENASK
jgi:hypothetical protein